MYVPRGSSVCSTYVHVVRTVSEVVRGGGSMDGGRWGKVGGGGGRWGEVGGGGRRWEGKRGKVKGRSYQAGQVGGDSTYDCSIGVGTTLS